MILSSFVRLLYDRVIGVTETTQKSSLTFFYFELGKSQVGYFKKGKKTIDKEKQIHCAK